jgi:acetyl esterase/lipase
MKYAILLILFLHYHTYAQTIKRDTSFTTYSAFIKEQKKRPYISIAQPLKSGNFISKNNIVYKHHSTGDLLLDVITPKNKGAKPFPVVLFVFGGGWRSGNRKQNIPLAQKISEQGYVSITADYRLSTEAAFPAAVYDLKNAIRWIKANAKNYNIDTNKIAVCGFSAGGQLAALIGTTNSDHNFDKETINNQSSQVQAVIDADGVLAFDHPESEEVSKDPNKVSAAALWFGGNLNEKPELWFNAAPLNHADQNTVPMLFVNSSLPRFHAGRDDLIAKIKPFNIYTEVHTLPDTPHPFWLFNPWFEKVSMLMLSFLDRQFKN